MELVVVRVGQPLVLSRLRSVSSQAACEVLMDLGDKLRPLSSGWHSVNACCTGDRCCSDDLRSRPLPDETDAGDESGGWN